MKIVDIYIYGYGKFKNTRFSNLQHHQGFFGENEAGKSTIMSFIHSILFGFPTRLQSELRYEPKKGAKYGGQITAIFPTKGKVTIERVKGKATGDVVVTLEDGAIGGEDLLKNLLQGIDKTLFQSIFSFNLQGLQNIHQMKEEDIGRFLFSTSTLGSDRLMKVENELVKEMESRFKPNGRNPSLNIKLKELQQLRKELRKSEEGNEQYLRLLQTKEALDSKIKEKKRTINHLTQKEHLIELQKESKRKLSVYQQRLDLVTEELNNLDPNFLLIEMESEMNSVLESLPLVEKWKQENTRFKVKLNKLEENIRLLQQQIHLPFTNKDISTINTSIFMKEKAADLQARQMRLIEKKRDLEEQFQEEKRRLEEYEWKANELKRELIPEKDLQEMKERLAERETKEVLSYQQKDISDKLSFLQLTVQQAEEKQKSEKQRYLLFTFLFLVLCGWGIMSQMIELIVAGGAGILLTLLASIKLIKTKNSDHFYTEIKNLQKKKHDIDNRLELPMEQEHLLKHQLETDRKIREKLFQLSVRLEKQQESYDLVIDRFELWEKEESQLRKELLETGKQLKLPEEIAVKYLFDAFQIIDEMKRLFQEMEYLEEQIKTNDQSIEAIERQIQKWSLAFLSENNIPFQEAAMLLKRKLREELEKQVYYKEKKEQFLLMQEELKVQELEGQRINEEMSNLHPTPSVNMEGSLQVVSIKEEVEDELSLLLDELAELKYQIQLIEDGGTYADLYHSYKQLEEGFNEEGREWVKYAAAQEILHNTIQHYKQERLPKMLKKAEEYLSYLTGGRYSRILPKQEGSGFFIESKDQILFDANELSQATTEQIYVAIRLALTATIYEKYEFPLIIDDSFVNFDEDRTRKVFELLLKHTEHQVLFFTCHKSHLPYFKKEEIICLAK